MVFNLRKRSCWDSSLWKNKSSIFVGLSLLPCIYQSPGLGWVGHLPSGSPAINDPAVYSGSNEATLKKVLWFSQKEPKGTRHPIQLVRYSFFPGVLQVTRTTYPILPGPRNCFSLYPEKWNQILSSSLRWGSSHWVWRRWESIKACLGFTLLQGLCSPCERFDHTGNEKMHFIRQRHHPRSLSTWPGIATIRTTSANSEHNVGALSLRNQSQFCAGHFRWDSVKVKVSVSQLCPTLCDCMDCSPPGSPVHGILQARILKWVAIFFSRRPSWPRYQTWVSCIVGKFFTLWATREAHGWEGGRKIISSPGHFDIVRSQLSR